MSKHVVNFVQLTVLHNILNEIKNLLSFDIQNYPTEEEFLKDLNKNNSLSKSTIITNSNIRFKSASVNIDKRNILVFDNFSNSIK